MQKQNETKTFNKDFLFDFLTRFYDSQNLVMANIINLHFDSQSIRNANRNRSNGVFLGNLKRARGSILEIKSGFCETSDKDKTKVYRGSELKQSPILAQKTNALNFRFY